MTLLAIPGNPATFPYVLTSARALSNSNSAQSVFGVSATVTSSTLYELIADIYLTATSGGTAASVGFSLGGTATYTAIRLLAMGAHSGTSLNTNAANTIQKVLTSASNTLVVPSNTNWYKRIFLHGVVSVNAGGTLTPQVTWSAAPGGAPSVDVGSFIRLTPFKNSGMWA